MYIYVYNYYNHRMNRYFHLITSEHRRVKQEDNRWSTNLPGPIVSKKSQVIFEIMSQHFGIKHHVIFFQVKTLHTPQK